MTLSLVADTKSIHQSDLAPKPLSQKSKLTFGKGVLAGFFSVGYLSHAVKKVAADYMGKDLSFPTLDFQALHSLAGAVGMSHIGYAFFCADDRHLSQNVSPEIRKELKFRFATGVGLSLSVVGALANAINFLNYQEYLNPTDLLKLADHAVLINGVLLSAMVGIKILTFYGMFKEEQEQELKVLSDFISYARKSKIDPEDSASFSDYLQKLSPIEQKQLVMVLNRIQLPNEKSKGKKNPVVA